MGSARVSRDRHRIGSSWGADAEASAAVVAAQGVDAANSSQSPGTPLRWTAPSGS
jgi:hypothetical protein